MNEIVATKKAVGISYILKNGSGEIIDTAPLDDPMWFIQGMGSLLPAVESALEGKSAGHSLNLALSPADGYGVRDEKMVMEVPREAFPKDLDIEVGMPFMLQAEGDIGARPWIAKSFDDTTVTLDGNHPLAGVPLNFEITVVDVRDEIPQDPTKGSCSCC